MIVPILAPGDIFRLIASLNVLVVNKSRITVTLPGFDSVKTDVELGAILGVRVVGVGDDLAIFVHFLEVLGALEAVVEFFVGIASTVLAVGHIRPDARAGFKAEVKPGNAIHFDFSSIDAVVEDVTDGVVRMWEESVLPGANSDWSGFLKFSAILAVHVVWLVAFVRQFAGWVKHQSIWAQFFRDTPTVAFVVFITLIWILKLPILLWASKLEVVLIIGAIAGANQQSNQEESTHFDHKGTRRGFLKPPSNSRTDFEF